MSDIYVGGSGIASQENAGSRQLPNNRLVETWGGGWKPVELSPFIYDIRARGSVTECPHPPGCACLCLYCARPRSEHAEIAWHNADGDRLIDHLCSVEQLDEIASTGTVNIGYVPASWSQSPF